MTAKRHNGAAVATPDDALLDAARECVLAVGVKRTTLTDVARRAGVSRMTLYRRWPDMQTLFADLTTREWLAVAGDASAADATPAGVAVAVVAAVTALRGNPLFARIVAVDPELLLPYLLTRRGRAQDAFLDLVTAAIVKGRRDGRIRDAEPALLARTVLLTAQGFALSARTMTDRASLRRLDAELRLQVERYLAP